MIKPAVRWLWRNIGFVCVALVLVYCVRHAFDPPRLNWGDSDSDYNVLTSGRNFAKYGFLKLHLTPYLLDPAVLWSADKSKIYTHYPQLPDLMNGALRVVLGLSTLPQFRLVALGFSFAALFFVYALIRDYWARQTAQIAVGLWVINPLWIQHADYLHHGPYAAFFGFGCIYFFTRYLADETQRGWFFACGAFLFLSFMASYDLWFFAPLMLLLVAVHHHHGLRMPAVRLLAALATFAVAAIAFKIATNIWGLGGWNAFVDDLRFQAIERTTNPSRHVQLAAGILPTAYGRIDRYFSLLLIPVAMFWAIAPLLRARFGDRLAGLRVPNPWWMLAAALPFLGLFAELWISQYYPALLVLPFYAVACAAVIVIVLESKQRWAPWLAGALVAALFSNSLVEDARAHPAFFQENEIRSLRAELDTLAQPGQYIMTNHLFYSFYAYYFDHPTIELSLNEPSRIKVAIAYYTNPKRDRVTPPSGALFVQNKQVVDEMYDRHIYQPLATHGLWAAWANPEKYRPAIDAYMASRDSTLVAAIADVGEKVYETPAYAIWRIKPRAEAPTLTHQN